MSISFGGLGLLSLRNPFAELVGMALAKTDLRSMFCLVVFLIVIFILAYLTNPSENSFRAYLTEQSFRQHLSRLDDNADDNHAIQTDFTSLDPSRRSTLATTHALSFDNSSPFHFANRASVSLRTPKHVFHSFGIFTIAAMVPLARSARREDRDAYMISDSWYVGAFGRWWRGGVIEAWYQDVIARSKDEESWSSGILSMKNLDMLNEYDGLPFSTKGLPPHLSARSSPPKLRNRERLSHQPVILPTRSSTPPPLPKSASLPLHIARAPSIPSDRPLPPPLLQVHSQSCHAADQVHLGSPVLSKSPSTLFDQSPRIAEVLRQISHSKATILDLRAQLSDCQSCNSQSHLLLQGELETFRERKRKEDASKLELKSRTKALDDSKRTAEGMKKDAEKKLKAAHTARDNATQRMDHLDKEISRLQGRLNTDGTFKHGSHDTVSVVEQEITDALEHKKREIRIAEDIVIALNQRARELEEKLSEVKEKLVRLKERNEVRKRDLPLRPSQIVPQHCPSSPWSYAHTSHDPTNRLSTTEAVERRRSLTGFEAINGLGRRPSISRDAQILSSPLGTLATSSHSSPSAMHSANNAAQAALRTNGYSVFDDNIVAISRQHIFQPQQHVTKFSPFEESEVSQPLDMPVVVPSSGQSLISSTPINSTDMASSTPKSVQSENNVYMDKERRGFDMAPYSQPIYHRTNDNNKSLGFSALTASPVAHHPADYEVDPFEVRFMSAADYGHSQLAPPTAENPMNTQRTPWLHRTNSDPNHYITDVNQVGSIITDKMGPRRWFSTASKEKPKKGLNPDAKVFSLAKKSPSRILAPGPVFDGDVHSVSVSAYDALNPNGLGSKVVPSPASANNSLLRAFAPSPAEREALQRALGGSTNTSFERLPSLSDVGSIPSSPSHTHIHPVSHAPQHSARELGKVLPSWLQSLPRIRKANFSPWEDEEPSSVNVIDGDAER